MSAHLRHRRRVRLLGMAYAGLVTPGGRLLRRSSTAEGLPFLFAAQFSLSHAGWLLAYPLAGSVGTQLGMPAALLALAASACWSHGARGRRASRR